MRPDIDAIRERAEYSIEKSSDDGTISQDLLNVIRYIHQLEAQRDAAIMDMSVACQFGKSCAVCVNCRDRGDQFPCAIANEWCGGAGWEWRGVKHD